MITLGKESEIQVRNFKVNSNTSLLHFTTLMLFITVLKLERMKLDRKLFKARMAILNVIHPTIKIKKKKTLMIFYNMSL